MQLTCCCYCGRVYLQCTFGIAWYMPRYASYYTFSLLLRLFTVLSGPLPQQHIIVSNLPCSVLSFLQRYYYSKYLFRSSYILSAHLCLSRPLGFISDRFSRCYLSNYQSFRSLYTCPAQPIRALFKVPTLYYSFVVIRLYIYIYVIINT